MYTCPTCGNKFVSTPLLQRHFNEKHEIKVSNLKCHMCGLALSNRKRLRLHMEKHTSDRSIQCDYCDKTFFGPETKKNHMLVYHRREKGLEEKEYICEVCSKVCKSSTRLREHMEMHKDKPDARFKCEHCGKQLKQRNSYSRHLMGSHGIGHRCEACQKLFYSKEALLRHMRSEHGITL